MRFSYWSKWFFNISDFNFLQVNLKGHKLVRVPIFIFCYKNVLYKFIKEINYKINIAWDHWLTSKPRCFSPNYTNTSAKLWNIWSKTQFNNPSSVSLEIKSSTSIVNLLPSVPTYLNSNFSALVSILVNSPKPESSDSV